MLAADGSLLAGPDDLADAGARAARRRAATPTSSRSRPPSGSVFAARSDRHASWSSSAAASRCPRSSRFDLRMVLADLAGGAGPRPERARRKRGPVGAVSRLAGPPPRHARAARRGPPTHGELRTLAPDDPAASASKRPPSG